MKTSDSNLSTYKKKNVLIISTGGTFNCIKTKEGLIPSLSKEDLKDKYLYRVADDVNIEFIDLISLDSANIVPKHWKLIADTIGANYKSNDGIVVIHGTDTLAYTSSMLSHMLKGIPISVVLTGSQLSITNPVADALENMRAAIYMAKLGHPGVYVAFNRKIMNGAYISKTHSMSFGAFESINEPDVGMINAYGMSINQELLCKADPFFKVRSNYSEDVFLLTLTPGFKPDFLDVIKEKGYKAIVIESFGLGGLPNKDNDIATKVKELIDAGIKVIVLSQCAYDGVDFDVYQTGLNTKNLGVIYLPKVTKEYAVTKLMWELGNAE